MRPCEFCGNPYVPKRKDQRYCSKPCRTEGHNADCRAYYNRNADQVKETVRRYRRANVAVISERSRAKYQRNREDILERKKSYWLNNMESIKEYRRTNADKLKASAERYRIQHRGRLAEADRRRRQLTAAHRSQVNRAWRRANREACRVIHQRKRASKRTDSRAVTLKDWTRLLNRFNNCCSYCGSADNLHMEHVVPLSRGGRHAIGNILPACATCNGSKSTKFLAEWRLTQIRRAA